MGNGAYNSTGFPIAFNKLVDSWYCDNLAVSSSSQKYLFLLLLNHTLFITDYEEIISLPVL